MDTIVLALALIILITLSPPLFEAIGSLRRQMGCVLNEFNILYDLYDVGTRTYRLRIKKKVNIKGMHWIYVYWIRSSFNPIH